MPQFKQSRKRDENWKMKRSSRVLSSKDYCELRLAANIP